MKNKNLSNWLLVSMVLVCCCCQQISAGIMVKTVKTKNSTNATKDAAPTAKHSKPNYKAKIATTKKPEVETTTLLPLDLDLDGRSAYINNQFVADPEESVQDTASPLYELLQQQMENVLLNTGDKIEVFTNNSPQMKEAVDDEANEKPPQKPLFAHDMGQFDDYDEEDTSEYGTDGEYIPDNCEDTQESLGDNDENTAALLNNNQENLQDNYGQTLVDSSQHIAFAQTVQNKPYDLQTSAQASHKKPQASNKNPSKPTQKPQSLKTKPSNQQHSNQNSYGQPTTPTDLGSYNTQALVNNYGHMKPSENYAELYQNQNKLSSLIPRPQYANGNLQQAAYNSQKSTTKPVTQHSKPKPFYTTLNQKTQVPATQHSSNYANASTKPYFASNPLTSPFPTVNTPLTVGSLYGQSNAETSSPFSSTSGQKHNLTFRTVASSTQYVASPLADFMFKLSIGMAKPANSYTKPINSYGDNQAQIYNVLSDMETKTDAK